jgi:repressor LexA
MTAPTVALTQRDHDAVEFIRQYADYRGFAPTVREVGEAVGLTSSASAAALIDRLISVGVVRRSPGIPRSLVVVDAEDGS